METRRQAWSGLSATGRGERDTTDYSEERAVCQWLALCGAASTRAHAVSHLISRCRVVWALLSVLLTARISSRSPHGDTHGRGVR